MSRLQALIALVVWVVLTACSSTIPHAPLDPPTRTASFSSATPTRLQLPAKAISSTEFFDPTQAERQSPLPTHTPSLVPTQTLVPSATPTPTTPAWVKEIEQLLPAPIYYLSDQSGIRQIWRVETNGQENTQITNLEIPVEEYDISPVTGLIAYSAGTGLWLSDEHGQNPYSIDLSAANFNEKPSETIMGLAWSHDGKKLTFAGRDGIWIYNLEDAQLTQILANPPYVVAYAPAGAYSWSSDDRYLLFIEVFANSDFADVVYLQIDRSVLVKAEGLSQCSKNFRWSEDNYYVFSSYDKWLDGFCEFPGMARWHLPSNSSIRVIGKNALYQYERMAEFVEGAQQGPDGWLYYFYNRTRTSDDVVFHTQLTLYRSEEDGVSKREQLRSDSYYLDEALWAPDMSFVVIVACSDGICFDPGVMILLTIDNKPAVALALNAIDIRWGKGE